VATPDEIAGRYALGRVLGRGGMGTVWAATDRLLGRQVAVKVLQVVDARPDAIERFRREAQFLAGLTHPNVVTVFDFGIDEHRAWLVMELLPGPTLAQLLADNGPLPIDTVVASAAAIASALAAAHEAGIIHRDVKPANLMLDSHGDCTLLDLGIARLTGTTADTVSGLTETGMLLGTAAYVAPEIVHGQAATPASDIYGLGATVYTLLTGQAPYQAETPVGTLAQHVSAPVPHPAAVRADVPAGLDALVVAMLAKDPAERPTAREVAARLDAVPRVPESAPTVVMPVSSDPSATRLLPVVAARRSTPIWIIAAAAFVVVLLIVALVVAFAGGGSGRPTAKTSSRSPTPSTSPTPSPTPTHRPTPTHTVPPPTSATQALAALADAVNTAADSGALAPKDAQDFQHRIDDFSHSLDTGKTADLPHKLDDFEQHLTDLEQKGGITRPAYNHILHALEDFRGVVGG
jgi:eukaryotic-like serine/threonine-protein kinase